MKNILVVGAGFSGVTIARELADSGHNITVIDKKDHVGGHCHDYLHSTGIRVHKYGPHIFHTSNIKVFNWLSRFTEWVDYEHRVVARLETGETVPFPPNKETLKHVNAEKILDTFYRPYSEKMWGMKLEQVSPNILERVPIRHDFEDRYFPSAKFQKLPKHGYTALFEKILAHNSINLFLETPFAKNMLDSYDFVFNSMPIDEFFNYSFGYLPYRSIIFHQQIKEVDRLTPHPVINYTNNLKYTRHTEWKNFPGHGANCEKTIVTYEEPCDFQQNNFERYYPVKDINGENRKLYQKYNSGTPVNMKFIGRCGSYVYIDMDQAVSSALAIARKFKIEAAS